jgi:hypothetical protein
VTDALLRWLKHSMDVDYYVRVWFEHNGERRYEDVGPFDRYFAELICTDYAEQPYLYGMTYCRDERAKIVRAEAAA